MICNHIHIVGFPRGGTAWTRNIIKAHPDVTPSKNVEDVIFRDNHSRGKIEVKLERLFPYIEGRTMTKAPLDANNLHVWKEQVPEMNIVYVLRDPRDSFASHYRSSMGWTNIEANNTVDGVFRKLRSYWANYLLFWHGIKIVRYEDLYLDFDATVDRLFKQLNLRSDADIIRKCMEESSFKKVSGRDIGQEDAASHYRKGIIGDHKNLPRSIQKDFDRYIGFIRQCGYEED